MTNSRATVPPPCNEPVLTYAPGSPERKALQTEVARQSEGVAEIPLWIAGKPMTTRNTVTVSSPHQHRHSLAQASQADGPAVEAAIDAAIAAAPGWGEMSFDDRAAVFLKAADLAAGPYRARLNASTMLGQSKTCHQAEIDAACEIIDFFRYNVAFAAQIHAEQPTSGAGMWNRLEYRPLEGFVFAITPFNFTAIAANLPAAPALMGDTVVWKPATTALLSNFVLVDLLHEAGLPEGVINFVPGSPEVVAGRCLADSRLAGVHFTGSTAVFNSIWQTVGQNIGRYRTYPRLVGETGGKDFIFAHPSADPDALLVALVRGAFEYQGQKCSAASRAYIPESLWKTLRPRVVDLVQSLKMGDVADFSNFMGAVIDAKAYARVKGYIEHARTAGGSKVQIIAGGECDDRTGYFIRPTILETQDPQYRSMTEEIFGPVLTVFPYADRDFETTLKVCESSGSYALTGAIFARDRRDITRMTGILRHAAGNFYINDKPTGAVVGQQPFGGARASGTNDKAGSPLNLLRWTSPRTIKETFAPPKDYRYPYMAL